MGDISKEAMDEARRLLENSSRVGTSGIAAALQKLMDEREKAVLEKFEMFGREQAALANYKDLRASSIEKLRMEESARAEKAELRALALEAKCELLAASLKQADRKLRDIYEGNVTLESERGEPAEARLAELVREVREWVNASCDCNSCVQRREIIAKYESPEPAKPEPTQWDKPGCPRCNVDGRTEGEFDCPYDFEPEDDHG